MATIVPLGEQFFDATGAVLSGGSLTFYVAETLTLATIYSTQDEGVVLANPLVLSSEGRVPSAGVWANGDYRIILKDSNGVPIFDIDDMSLVNPYDWTGLTASIADINAISGSLATPGTVIASKAVVVDASKNISSFGTLTASHLDATTAIKTPQINDANDIVAITIPPVTSQVNAITITPTVTTVSPSITSTGADANIDLILAGKGTGAVTLSGLRYPVADGTVGQIVTTDGAGVLSFEDLPLTAQIVKQVVTASTTTNTSSTSVIPGDNTIPQITEGTQVLTLTIVPTSATSNIILFVTAQVGATSGSNFGTAISVFRDSTANAIGATFSRQNNTLLNVTASLIVSVPSTSTASTTFQLRFGPTSTGTASMNGLYLGGSAFGGVMPTTIIAVEF